MSKLKRDYIVDILKVVALLFVIIIHNSYFNDERVIQYGFPFYLKFAVPIFMILSGYVLTRSYENKKINTLKEAYDKEYIINRIIRFLIPYLFIIFLQIVFRFFFMSNDFSIRDSIYYLISGGYGKGGYYNVLVFQLIFLFLLLYFLIKKKGLNGLVIAFFINLLYEILQSSYMMSDSAYRLIILRYIFFISSGIYMYTSKDEFKPYVGAISAALGAIYVLIVDYTSYNPLFITKWKDTSLFFGFYVIPIVYNILKIKRRDIKLKFISLVSKASYNIFLVQMLIYYIFECLRYNFTDNVLVNILVMIVMSFLLGIIFYKIESPITKKLIKKTNNIDMEISNTIKKVLLKEDL